MKSFDRRKALKLLGTTGIWTTPLLQVVSLPTHAQTSAALSLTVESTNFATDTCGSFGETVNITGTVVGSNVAGAEINILYTDDPVDDAFANI